MWLSKVNFLLTQSEQELAHTINIEYKTKKVEKLTNCHEVSRFEICYDPGLHLVLILWIVNRKVRVTHSGGQPDASDKHLSIAKTAPVKPTSWKD